MNDKPQLLLEHHLKKLKLPAMLRDYQKIAGICAARKSGTHRLSFAPGRAGTH
jgi:hypothetical protein